MTIGDVNSSARGSGARYNDGKPPFDLIPLRLLADSFDAAYVQGKAPIHALRLLGQFQQTRDANCLHAAIIRLGMDGWAECAHVFDYGRRKYAAWNWAKGMPWSVPFGCASRHLVSLVQGEEVDPESKHPHRGHVFCNVVMLLHYVTAYPEGDDLPPPELFPHAKDAP
jgi:hypothetical protein